MNDQSQISLNKVKLIYAFDKKSPVFTRIAAEEIEKKDYYKAIRILEDGLNHFPDYATAYILLGQAYAYSGDIKKGIDYIERGAELIDSPDTIRHYKDVFARNIAKSEVFNLEEQISEYEFLEGDNYSGDAQESGAQNKGNASTRIISETFAEIHIKQGHLSEAIGIFEELIDKDPEKEQYYRERIAELKLLLEQNADDNPNKDE